MLEAVVLFLGVLDIGDAKTFASDVGTEHAVHDIVAVLDEK